MQESSGCLSGSGYNDPGLSLCRRDFHWQAGQITFIITTWEGNGRMERNALFFFIDLE